MTTLGKVTASITHELNQPLAAIVNNASASLALLDNGSADIDEVRAALTDIVSDGERTSAIIERVRALARRSPPEQEAVAFGDIVADVVALTASQAAARHVAVHTDIAADLPNVMGDRVQLQLGKRR